MVTGIIEIQTTGINGIRDILAKNFNGIQNTQTPPPPLMEPYLKKKDSILIEPISTFLSAETGADLCQLHDEEDMI